ncbi:MAG: CZB domain-containing protein [Halopseudomonas sp.]
MISRSIKSEALGRLLDARMQHTKWVAEVLHERDPQVTEDHTLCEFGKWMIAVRDELDDLEEFQDLDVPHRELHMVYKVLKSNPTHQILREEIKLLSEKLISRIDALEQRLAHLD